jgi:hypothetical protein
VKDKVQIEVFDTKTGQIEHSVNTVTKDIRMAEESVSSVRKEVAKKITKSEVEAVVDDAMEVLKAEAAKSKDLDGLSAGYFKCLSCDSVHEEMHTKPSRVNTNKMLGPAAMSPPPSRGGTPQQGAMRPPLGNGYASGGQMMGNTTGDVRALLNTRVVPRTHMPSSPRAPFSRFFRWAASGLLILTGTVVVAAAAAWPAPTATDRCHIRIRQGTGSLPSMLRRELGSHSALTLCSLVRRCLVRYVQPITRQSPKRSLLECKLTVLLFSNCRHQGAASRKCRP